MLKDLVLMMLVRILGFSWFFFQHDRCRHLKKVKIHEIERVDELQPIVEDEIQLAMISVDSLIYR